MSTNQFRIMLGLIFLIIGFLIGVISNIVFSLHAVAGLTTLIIMSLIIGLWIPYYRSLMVVCLGVILGSLPMIGWNLNLVNLFLDLPTWQIWSIAILTNSAIAWVTVSLGWLFRKIFTKPL